ncbi:MAG TPA: hypothetical protein VFB36_12330 [Nevskiaceae bacterium]|nr:hypothetical protein [Nevskiaceae bacterium]
MLTRSFWRLVAMASAAAAGAFLIKTLRTQPDDSRVARTAKRTARKVVRKATEKAEDAANGDARRAH